MSSRYPKFIADIEETDPKLFEAVTKTFDVAMAPGELDTKTKMLIAMALDAMIGSEEGVKTLANVARQMGVSDSQIAETLRIVYFVAGNKVLQTTGAAFD